MPKTRAGNSFLALGDTGVVEDGAGCCGGLGFWEGVGHLHWLVLSLVGLVSSSFLFLPFGFLFLLFGSAVICWTQAPGEQKKHHWSLGVFFWENICLVSEAL